MYRKKQPSRFSLKTVFPKGVELTYNLITTTKTILLYIYNLNLDYKYKYIYNFST